MAFQRDIIISYHFPHFFLYLAFPSLAPFNPPALIFPLSPYNAVFYISYLIRSSPISPLSLTSCLTSVGIINETYNTLPLKAQGYMQKSGQKDCKS